MEGQSERSRQHLNCDWRRTKLGGSPHLVSVCQCSLGLERPIDDVRTDEVHGSRVLLLLEVVVEGLGSAKDRIGQGLATTLYTMRRDSPYIMGAVRSIVVGQSPSIGLRAGDDVVGNGAVAVLRGSALAPGPPARPRKEVSVCESPA